MQGGTPHFPQVNCTSSLRRCLLSRVDSFTADGVGSGVCPGATACNVCCAQTCSEATHAAAHRAEARTLATETGHIQLAVANM